MIYFSLVFTPQSPINKKKQTKIQTLLIIINSIKPLALNDAVNFNFKVVNLSISYLPKCSKIKYDENYFIISDSHKAVKFNFKVVNLYREESSTNLLHIFYSPAQEFYPKSPSSPTKNCLK